MLTLVAWFGIVLGALGHSRERSPEVAAGGGGLLAGICVFWLMPEIADESSWARACVFVLTACTLLFLVDHLLEQAETRSQRHVLIPLLTAAGLHSVLDGWSIRAVTANRLAGTFLFLGLHSALPARHDPGVLRIFAATFAVAGIVAGLQHLV